MTASGADSFRCSRGRACHFIIDVEYMCTLPRLADDSAAIVKIGKIRITDADVHDFRLGRITKKPCIMRAGSWQQGHILDFMEHAVEFAGKGMGIRSDRSMRSICKVDILAQHIVARKARCIRSDCIETRFVLDKLVHIGRPEVLVLARTAMRRRSRLIAHMHIAFVIAYSFRAAGIHRKRALVGNGIDIC